MKGPGLRIDLDVRRMWRCAKCGKTVRTAGLVTAQRCGCSDQSQWMRLEQPTARAPFQPPHREPLPEYGDETHTPAAPEQPFVAAPAEGPSPNPVEDPGADSPAIAVEPQIPVRLSDPTPDRTSVDDFGAGLVQPDKQEQEPRLEPG